MKIQYNLRVETEYHIGTGLEHPGVVDRTLVTRQDGALVIPAEHFRGLVRDACTQLLHWLNRADGQCCEASLTKGPRQGDSGVLTTCGLIEPPEKSHTSPCVLCRLFGTTFTPRRYQFFDSTSVPRVSDLTTTLTDEDTRRVSMHNRVAPATGRVPEETFFSFEVGSPVTFVGQIERDGPQIDPLLLQEEIGLLLAGLRLVERVGARSGRGWGRSRVKVTELTLSPKEEPPKMVSDHHDVSAKVDAWLKAYLGLTAL